MNSAATSDRTQGRPRGPFSELLRVQGRLALREPYGLLAIGLPVGLLVVFWYIGILNPGGVSGTGLTILELYTPTILVISYVAISMLGLPATFVRDREIGWLRRVSTTPVGPSRLLAAQLLLNFIIAALATGVLIVAATALFGAPLLIGVEFVGVAILAIAELFSLGLLVAAFAPTQQTAESLAGGLAFLLFFLSGLWVQPVQVGGLLQTVMYYSPAGSAVRALLYSVFNVPPPTLPFLRWGSIPLSSYSWRSGTSVGNSPDKPKGGPQPLACRAYEKSSPWRDLSSGFKSPWLTVCPVKPGGLSSRQIHGQCGTGPFRARRITGPARARRWPEDSIPSERDPLGPAPSRDAGWAPPATFLGSSLSPKRNLNAPTHPVVAIVETALYNGSRRARSGTTARL